MTSADRWELEQRVAAREAAERVMTHYLVTWQESDGNDCSVFDTIVPAESEEAALNLLSDAVAASLTANGSEFSEDGNLMGFCFECSEDCSEDCEGHGGISHRTCEAYATEADAVAACSTYHRRWEMPLAAERSAS